MPKNLVIVESPAKAKTIEKFLGKDYKVLSSYGHIRDLKKKDLIDIAGISHYVISKMNKGENITVEVVGKICRALDCTPNDIMEFIEE